MVHTSGWVHVALLAKERQVLELVPVETARDVDAFTPDNDHLLALEQGLGHDGGETTQQMASAVDDEGFILETRHFGSKMTQKLV